MKPLNWVELTRQQIKALATLDQLKKKGLIKKEKFATMTAGNISAFYPRTWEGCTTMTSEKYEWLLKKLELTNNGVTK